MTCEEVRARLTDYVCGKLDAELKVQIDKHVSECPSCQRDLCVARLVETGEAVSDDSAAIIRIAYTIIEQAIRDSAREIRIEPEEHGIRVLYGSGGAVQHAMALPKSVQTPLFSRLKTMGDLDTAETGANQEGRIPIRWHEKDFTVLISCTPTEHGEQIVMRVVD